MSRSIKQIYATFEICENELRVLVAEYFNTRFNILRIDRKSTKAINDFKIVDTQLFIDDIKSLIRESSGKLGAKIEQVILVIPAYNFKRFPIRSKIVPDKGIISKADISRAISNSLKAKVDFDVMTVTPVINKYTINGISTRRMPEKEICDELYVDIDLLCADKEICYTYVSALEEAGLRVVDIVINTYAVGKEASLIEESLKQNVVCLDIKSSCTYLSLFSKGKLISTEILYDGLKNIADKIKVKYDIPDSDIYKLIKYSLDYRTEYLDDIIYAYNSSDRTNTITIKELNDICLEPLNALVDDLVAMSKPILDQGAMLYVTGEGQQMKSLCEMIEDKANCLIKSYYPETIGAKDSTLMSLYGALFVYKDKVDLNNLNVSCIDLLEYDSHIDQKDIDTEGETITTKIKNLFKQYVQGGD